MQCVRYAVVHQNRMKNLHVSSLRRYPDAPTLPLPTNVSEIFANETGRFTPERARDIAAPVLLYGKNDCRSYFSKQLTKPATCSSSLENCSDTHIDSYDCFGAVSLNSTMQSNVPKPFCSNGKSTHLNMPGGQWARDGKYIAEDMQKSHYRSIRLPQLKLDKSGLTSYITTNTIFQTMYKPKYIYIMEYSTKPSQPVNNVLNTNNNKDQGNVTRLNLSTKSRLRNTIKDFGYTCLAFHIGISLLSFGACYTAVDRGMDFAPIIQYLFDTSEEKTKNLITGSTFVVAYSIHKLMAPIRISITLGVTPFLVSYLRKVGIIKTLQRTRILKNSS
ncbi:hypothetical protein WN48_02751 [Eufriesea mexicana]|uniref:DUF1279 domain-containing protein n=2 Tax=Eufriesea mexicana TaxID=516756 RepID=A0A310S727_9HYME|nr:hypothetical protein WN48_02751 [Eufriesea mexicana]